MWRDRYAVGVADVRWLDDDEAAAWRNWVSLSARVHAAVARDLARDHRLSEAEYAVLVNLSEAPCHRVRMTELAVRLEWSRSRLSHLVGRMEARGLLQRVDCAEDGRSSFAVLTARGLEQIRDAAPDHVASVRRHLIDVLGRDELRQLRVITGAVLDRMEATGACPVEDPCDAVGPDPCDAGDR